MRAASILEEEVEMELELVFTTPRAASTLENETLRLRLEV